MINTLRELARVDGRPEIDVENSAGGGDGARGGAGGDDDRGGAADGHAAAWADETVATLVMEAAVQICLDEDEACPDPGRPRYI